MVYRALGVSEYYGLYRSIGVEKCISLPGMNTETTTQTTNLSQASGPGSYTQALDVAAPSQSLDPISAVTARDPYGFYRDLTARRPLYYDEALGMWVASSAQAVESILNCSRFRVRPLNEAVPKSLIGTRAGEVFGHLVRMQDGERQVLLKRAVCGALMPVDAKGLLLPSETWMQHLLKYLLKEESVDSPPDIAFSLPVYVLGSLLGIPSDLLPRCVGWMDDFVRSIAPGSTPEQITRGSTAAEALTSLFQELLQQAQFPDYKNFRGMPGNVGLLVSFARSTCRHAGHDESAIIANAIGFLSQSYEATAGLIGNTLIVMGNRPELRHRLVVEPALLGAVISELARHDPPVQNTRRFLAEDSVVAGHEMQAGDVVLLILAAANRDPAVNPEPERFNPARPNPVLFTFSAGAHLCPGAAMALALAEGAVRQILASPIDLERLVEEFDYKPSQNGRIPLLNWESA